ncbi:hypothetical protein ABZ754_05045 [Micromonospora purpureochromogenes]|uniref:arsenate-mycothiol transferase ArsC n=1 Tax=Micromonospora purpureochromogenes TaxID=47872 RepID=UPI0033E70E7A
MDDEPQLVQSAPALAAVSLDESATVFTCANVPYSSRMVRRPLRSGNRRRWVSSPGAEGEDGGKFAMGGVIHVCTGNQARSPMAERLMEEGLRHRYGRAAESIFVTSGGTQGPPGRPMQPFAIAELEHRGVPADHFVSQLLDLQAVARAHLVLTATRQHRDEIVAQVPQALPFTFTWRELAWLVTGLTPGEVPGRYAVERLANLPLVAKQRRGYLQPLPPDLFDIADPMGGTRQDYRVAADQIEEAVEAVLRVV